MILFQRDWSKFPTAQPDLSTTNRSWVRLASVYREMGIKNHAFILALVNPTLKGVDPYAPNLTEHEELAIALECKVNPWYFFREVARVPAIGSDEPAKVEANRGNIALWWSFFNHVMIILIQIRQTGKSVSTDLLMTLLTQLVCQNTKINLMTKDDNLRRKNVERLKEISTELPYYLQLKTRDDVNNTEEITVKALNNVYNTHVPQPSPKRAYNMGRGLTSAIFHIDEAPFQPNIKIALPAALAATGAAVDKAKAAGTPYGTIITTTAGKKDDKDGKFIYDLLCDGAVWTEKFFDCYDDVELEKVVRANSRAGKFLINATFNHRQLGKDDRWLKQKLEESLQTGDDANRDYFNMWTSGGISNPLPVEVLERIANSIAEVQYTDISRPHGYITRWYIPEREIQHRMSTGRFVLGMDTSEASGGDDISFYLMDVTTLETIAVGTYNETNLITFSEWVCSILVAYKNITAIIERRSTGAMLLDYLLLMLPQHGEDPFKRLFNTVVQEAEEYPERWKEIRQPMARRDPTIYTRLKKCFGFTTSGSGEYSRIGLYGSTLQLAARRGADRIRDKATIDQIMGLITKNGRIDHEDGEHDDLVIGWLLTNWLLTHGKNLSHYGIDVTQVMSMLASQREMSAELYWQREQQRVVRDKMEALFTELTAEQDDFVSAQIELELRRLDSQVILESGEMRSVDALIKKAKDVKIERKRRWSMAAPYENRSNYSNYGAPAHLAHANGMMSDRPMSVRQMYSH
ncbi:hypothetical protein D3C71_78660 [compost metagenome]